MSGAGFVLFINLVVAGLFALAFLAASGYENTRAQARRFALAYVLGMAYFALEAALSRLGSAPFLDVAIFATFLAALTANGLGIALRYRQRISFPVVVAFFVGCVVLNLAIAHLPRQSFERLFLWQMPFVLVELAAALAVSRAVRRRGPDMALIVLLLATAANFAVKPVLGQWLGVGAAPSDYLSSGYALVSQSMGTVFGITTGLLLLWLLVRDIIGEMVEKSETDALSGLLNRRGFEEHARNFLKQVDRTHMPAAILIADLDHFKAVNDTFGHAAGDRAIACFSERLSAAMPAGGVAGRIGGEEFAVLLPGATIATARLFAESIRTGFSALPVAGFPADLRLTASFGVAAVQAGDTISDMLRRADIALYQAKNDGRDRVRVFPETAPAAPKTSSSPSRIVR